MPAWSGLSPPLAGTEHSGWVDKTGTILEPGRIPGMLRPRLARSHALGPAALTEYRRDANTVFEESSGTLVWDAQRLRVATGAAGVALWSWNVDTGSLHRTGRTARLVKQTRNISLELAVPIELGPPGIP